MYMEKSTKQEYLVVQSPTTNDVKIAITVAATEASFALCEKRMNLLSRFMFAGSRM